MSSTQQTLVRIYHPMFRKGYQDGREQYFRDSVMFRDQVLFSDTGLVEALMFVFFGDAGPEVTSVSMEELYYGIGQIVGKMSGCVIPRQPHEYQTQKWQEEFLHKVEQEYGTAMVGVIRQFWARQDRLVQKLDADTFECMIHRGLSPQCGA